VSSTASAPRAARRLLTDATTGVEAYANDTLARISGCTLEIALRQEDKRGESSLDIFVNDRSSSQEPLEVAFISGSQKLRVAVALAVGLGQYLGGGTSIRSLIIDEGFGSLDADGRQRIIHELRALAEHPIGSSSSATKKTLPTAPSSRPSTSCGRRARPP
jgi:exonuclease SbcC